MKLKFVLLSAFFVVTTGTLFAATSSENRDATILFIGITPVGGHPTTLLTRPYNLGLHLGSRFMIGIEYGSVNNSDYEHTYLDKKYNDGSTSVDEPNVSGSFTNEGIYIRIFANDSSLNLIMAYNVRTWKGEGTITKDSGTVAGNMEFISHIGSLGFGNMWQFDSGFTFSIDWYVDSRILEQSIKYNITSSTANPADEALAREDIEDFGKFLNAVSGFMGVGVVTFGISF